jgi:hypothetical protein
MSSYYASIHNPGAHVPGILRQYVQLSVAWSGTTLWVAGIDAALINDKALKTIPGWQCYSQSLGVLYPMGSHLPYGQVPVLHWQPVAEAVSVALPSFNHNYFHLTDTVPISLVPSSQEQAPTAMLVSCAMLASYVHTAPAIRLSALLWVVIGNNEALIIGSPLLPLQGAAYWRRGHVLLPVGTDWEFSNLSTHIEDALNPMADGWVLHRPNDSWLAVPFSTLVPLSRASVRSTLSAHYTKTT